MQPIRNNKQAPEDLGVLCKQQVHSKQYTPSPVVPVLWLWCNNLSLKKKRLMRDRRWKHIYRVYFSGDLLPTGLTSQLIICPFLPMTGSLLIGSESRRHAGRHTTRSSHSHDFACAYCRLVHHHYRPGRPVAEDIRGTGTYRLCFSSLPSSCRPGKISRFDPFNMGELETIVGNRILNQLRPGFHAKSMHPLFKNMF